MKVYHSSKAFSIGRKQKGGENLYEKYQALLAKENKTSYQVSKETGISQTAFSNWKSGRSEPGLESLSKLSKYFGVPIEYFLEQDTPQSVQ